MNLSVRGFAALVLVVSVAVLGTALASQYWGGLAPCELCLLQRWPWRVAIVVAALGVVIGARPGARAIPALLALVFATSIGLAAYHVGVEQHWLAGPSTCTTGPSGAQTLEQMKAAIMGHAPVMCDKIAWSLFGVSLAGWNLLASAVLFVVCAGTALRRRTTTGPLAAGKPAA